MESLRLLDYVIKVTVASAVALWHGVSVYLREAPLYWRGGEVSQQQTPLGSYFIGHFYPYHSLL